MSKEILALIKQYKTLFFSILFLGFFASFYIYSTTPVRYKATGSFKYTPPTGVTKTTKIDKNGTITYEAFEPGDGGLEFSNFTHSTNLSIRYNSESDTYVVTSNTLSHDSSISEVNDFITLIIAKNSDFLRERTLYAESYDEKVKLNDLLKYPHKSFPQLVKAEKAEPIDNRYIIVFFGIILSFLAAITAVILKKRVDEV